MRVILPLVIIFLCLVVMPVERRNFLRYVALWTVISFALGILFKE
jgi:hypothetical protein